jgi:hypothetical protein
MWRRVDAVLTDVSEERIASIFRVEGKIRKSAREASVRDVKKQTGVGNKHSSASSEGMVGGRVYMGYHRTGVGARDLTETGFYI